MKSWSLFLSKMTTRPTQLLDESEEPYEFSVRSNAAAGTQVGVVVLRGAEDDEEIDIISDSNSFNVAPRMIGPVGGGKSTMQAVVTVNGDLRSLVGTSEEFTITANGRLASTRTDSIKVRVSVTASNEAPVDF